MTDSRFMTFGSHGASLRDDLGGVFTDGRLQDWVGDLDERREFLADKILGTISWAKPLGKPAISHLYEAFVVDHARPSALRKKNGNCGAGGGKRRRES
jgi:hypothetical protein